MKYTIIKIYGNTFRLGAPQGSSEHIFYLSSYHKLSEIFSDFQNWKKERVILVPFLYYTFMKYLNLVCNKLNRTRIETLSVCYIIYLISTIFRNHWPSLEDTPR